MLTLALQDFTAAEPQLAKDLAENKQYYVYKLNFTLFQVVSFVYLMCQVMYEWYLLDNIGFVCVIGKEDSILLTLFSIAQEYRAIIVPIFLPQNSSDSLFCTHKTLFLYSAGNSTSLLPPILLIFLFWSQSDITQLFQLLNALCIISSILNEKRYITLENSKHLIKISFTLEKYDTPVQLERSQMR